MKHQVFKKYLLRLVSGTLCCLVVIAIFNFIVDPYGIYDAITISGFNEEKNEISSHLRLHKAYEVSDVMPGAISLGTSRTEVGIDSNHVGWAYPCYNLGFSGASIYEILRYYQHALYLCNTKQVVLMIDSISFFADRENAPDFDETRLAITYDGKKNITWGINEKFSCLLNTSRASVDTIRHQNSNSVSLYEKGRAVSLYWVVRDGNHVSFINRAKKDFENDTKQINGRGEQNSVSPYDYYYYRQILEIAHANDIELCIGISPCHVYTWEIMALDGSYPYYEEQWKRSVVKINEEVAEEFGKPPFPLWDFSVYNEFTMEDIPPIGDTQTRMRWYWDYSHYTKEFGDIILDLMFNLPTPNEYQDIYFGEMITLGNIEEHLREIRDSRELYRNMHPDIINEIQKLRDEY